MPNYSPLEASREAVLSDCAYLKDLQVWPIGTKVDPEGWLSNFARPDEPHALQLLNAFIYFGSDLVDVMFKAAFQNISSGLLSSAPPSERLSAWRTFLESALVTVVEGEDPNISDSGYVFARRARQLVGISEAQLKRPHEVMAALQSGWRGPIIFVDDFVGSGNQFCCTWIRPYLPHSSHKTFKDFAGAHPGELTFFYCNLISSHLGLNSINRHAPEVRIVAAHFISEKYSALVKDSLVWPETMKVTGPQFVESQSMAAGIPAHGGQDDWRGYRGLGLSLAFSHSTPDATLPLFYWNRGGWKPLIERG